MFRENVKMFIVQWFLFSKKLCTFWEMYLFPLNCYILDFGKVTFQKPFFELGKCIITDSHLNNISSGTL